MQYFTIPPPPVLTNYVRFFWVLECEVTPNNYYIHRSMADGCTELIFHYRGRFDEILENENIESSFLSGFHGQSKKYRRFKIDRNFGIFGAYLFPYALPGLIDIPASEFSGQMPQLNDVLGMEGVDLEEKVMTAPSHSHRAEILSSFLTDRLLKKRDNQGKIANAVKSVIDQKGYINIKKLAEQYCLSRRQFERKFKEHAGFSPKLFARINRFQSIFPQLAKKELPLTDVAYACGYYDQSHFIQEFKEFSGFNPKEFVKKESSETNIWIN